MSELNPANRTILPPERYFDPQTFRDERERIFGHSWLHVCHESKLVGVGAFHTCSLAGQSVIVVRGDDNELRAFHNVCQHRGSEMLEGSGRAPVIVCPYHGWTYRTDGRLKFARGSENIPGFDISKMCLSQLRLEQIGGFVFVSLDPQARSLADVYRGFETELRGFEPRLDELVHAYSVTFDLAVNWKLAVENYLEGYHLLTVHPSLRNSCDNDDWALTSHDYYVSFLGTADSLETEIGFFDGAEKQAQTNWWLWPMVMFEQMPGGNQVFTYNHIPLGPERTLQVVDFYFLSDTLSKEQKDSIEYVEKVVRIEDKVAIERWQRGLHSKGWRDGPLMIGPDMPEELTEKCVLHFQQLVSRMLAA